MERRLAAAGARTADSNGAQHVFGNCELHHIGMAKNMRALPRQA
jgi:hypothetical protein